LHPLPFLSIDTDAIGWNRLVGGSIVHSKPAVVKVARFNPLIPTLAFETFAPFDDNLFVSFYCTLIPFVCSIKHTPAVRFILQTNGTSVQKKFTSILEWDRLQNNS